MAVGQKKELRRADGERLLTEMYNKARHRELGAMPCERVLCQSTCGTQIRVLSGSKARIRILSVVDADSSVGVILEELQYDMRPR